MTWTKLSDTFTDDPQIIALTRDSRLLLVEATVYANRVLSDGHIPAAALRIFTDHPNPDDGMAELTAAGLLEQTPDGWHIVDFHRNQRSREQVEQTRESTRRRLENWRKAKARNGVSNGVTNGVSNGVGNALPDPTRPEGRGRVRAGAVALRRADAPPLEKALTDWAPFHRFGQFNAVTDPDGVTDLEIDATGLLVQAEVQPDGRISLLYVYVPRDRLTEYPHDRDEAARYMPNLDDVLKWCKFTNDGHDLALAWEGELNHRMGQIADAVARLLDSQPQAVNA